jgi:hypothetical protein
VRTTRRPVYARAGEKDGKIVKPLIGEVEVRGKFAAWCPESGGQASRVDGVLVTITVEERTPSVTVLAIAPLGI